MPPTYLGQSATPANAQLDTLPQLGGLLGALPATVVAALAAFNVIPVVASAAARDALIPAPIVNMRVERSDTGSRERYDGTDWRAEGVLRSAGPFIATTSKAGFVGDGVNDDSVALAAADVSAVASGGLHELDLSAAPTRVFVNSNLVLNARFRPNSAATARIYVGAGKTLTIADMEAGDYGVFDPTAPGTVVLPNRQVVNPMWGGVIGDNAHNEIPALNFVVASIGDNSTVEFPGHLTMRLDSAWQIAARSGLRFRSRLSPHPNGGNAATFTWNGGVTGAMVQLFSSDHCSIGELFGGFFFNLGSRGAGNYATTAIDIDLTGTNGVTGTRCQVLGNLFNTTNGPVTNAYQVVRISITSAQNQEYHDIIGNVFFTPSDRVGSNITVTIAGGTLGSFQVTAGAPAMDGTYVGRRFRIAGLDTTIATVTDGTHGTLTVAAAGAVTNTPALLGQCYGTGVQIGPSSNSKGHQIAHNSFTGPAKCIYQQNGSHLSFRNNFSSIGDCIVLDNGTEPTNDFYSNMEHAERYVVAGNVHAMPFKVDSSRLGAADHMAPGFGWIQSYNAVYTIQNITVDDPMRLDGGGVAQTFVHNFANFSVYMTSIGNKYNPGITAQQWGLLDATGHVAWPNAGIAILSEAFIGLPSVPFVSGLEGAFTKVSNSANRAAVTGYGEAQGGTPTMIGVRGVGENATGAGSAGILVGVQGEVGTQNIWSVFAAAAYAVRGLLPTVLATGGSLLRASALKAESPAPITGGAHITDCHGVDIDPIAATGITNPYGVRQRGTGDLNVLAGDTAFGTGTSKGAVVGVINISAGGNATPDSSGAEVYRYQMAGAATVNNPLNVKEGRSFMLEMFNNTAGPITPTLGSAFAGGSTAIGAGKWQGRPYVYDATLGKLKPTGPWSGDY